MADRHQARRTEQRHAEVVPVRALFNLARMQTHADPHGPNIGPWLRGERALATERGGHGVAGSHERGVHRVADSFEDISAVCFDAFPQEVVVPLERLAGRRGVAIEQARARLDIAEQERYVAVRTLTHEPNLWARVRPRRACRGPAATKLALQPVAAEARRVGDRGPSAETRSRS